MIPKVIHYCWFGGNPLPANTKKYIESWKKYCPDYEIKEWNESNFDVYSHPFMKCAYEAKAWAFVSDYARLKIIYENGGIYLDTDVELLKNLDFLLDKSFFIGVQQLGKYANTGLGFGAERYSDTVLKMSKMYDNLTFRICDKHELACPPKNSSVIESYGYVYSDDIWENGGITVFPCRYFDPISPGNTQDLLCSDSVSIHHYSASWESKIGRYKRKIINIIGQKHINKMKSMVKNIRNSIRR